MMRTSSRAVTACCAILWIAVAACEADVSGTLTRPRPILQAASPNEFVTTGGAEITLIVDDFTERWSFVARRNQDLSARGEFQMVSKLFGSNVTVHGDVTCFTVTGNRARLG